MLSFPILPRRHRLSNFLPFLLALVLDLQFLEAAPARAYDGIVEKKVFALPSYTTVGGQRIPNVRIGFETYGKLNSDRSNAILITHYFSGNSHAAGKYAATDAAPGYWDGLIGSGKAIDTDRYFVISSDTLVNLNVKSPKTVTTGPASIHPETGKPYGMSFPIVTIRDFVRVQKALIESLGITRLHAVAGGSMGSFQAFEWASAYPESVSKIIAVAPTAEIPAFTIGWLNIWGSPIRLDPKWNGGDYYGRGPDGEPLQGLALAFKTLSLQGRYFESINQKYGRTIAPGTPNPALNWEGRFAVEAELDSASLARARASDANSFLYICRAVQLFLTGHKGSLEEGLRDIRAEVLLMPARTDHLLFPQFATSSAEALRKLGKPVTLVEIDGLGGHYDMLGDPIVAKSEQIRDFLK